MKKNYSDFAKRNFEYYKTLKRNNIESSEIFRVVKLFDNLFEDLEIEEELKTDGPIK